jgi:hypothetical protein
MKPMAADTDNGIPVIDKATIPPTSANGMLAIVSSALRMN